MTEPKRIANILAQSQMMVGKTRESLDKAIEFALTELSEEKVCDILDKAERSLKAEINAKKYREEITEKKQFISLDANKLFEYWKHAYIKNFGKLVKHDYFIEAAKRVSAVLTRDKKACDEYGLDPDKGVQLYGGVGIGKSTMMKCFAYVLNMIGNPNYPTFKTVTAQKIADDFRQEGAVSLNKYTNIVNEGLLKNAGWYFDDVGTEEEANNYGNKENVIRAIFQVIENKPQLQGKIHSSTNLNREDTKALYGERIESRMNQLFNVIKFPVEAVDMRKYKVI